MDECSSYEIERTKHYLWIETSLDLGLGSGGVILGKISDILNFLLVYEMILSMRRCFL